MNSQSSSARSSALLRVTSSPLSTYPQHLHQLETFSKLHNGAHKSSQQLSRLWVASSLYQARYHQTQRERLRNRNTCRRWWGVLRRWLTTMLSLLDEYQSVLVSSDWVSFTDKSKANVAKINFFISIKGHSRVVAELDDRCNGEPSWWKVDSYKWIHSQSYQAKQLCLRRQHRQTPIVKLRGASTSKATTEKPPVENRLQMVQFSPLAQRLDQKLCLPILLLFPQISRNS